MASHRIQFSSPAGSGSTEPLPGVLLVDLRPRAGTKWRLTEQTEPPEGEGNLPATAAGATSPGHGGGHMQQRQQRLWGGISQRGDSAALQPQASQQLQQQLWGGISQRGDSAALQPEASQPLAAAPTDDLAARSPLAAGAVRLQAPAFQAGLTHGFSRRDTANEEQPLPVLARSAADGLPQQPQQQQVPIPQTLPPLASQQQQQQQHAGSQGGSEAGSQGGLETHAAAVGPSAPTNALVVGQPVLPGPCVPTPAGLPTPAVSGQPLQPQPY